MESSGYEARRQRRIAAEKARRQKQRQFRVRLAAAVGVLLLTGIVIFLVSRGAAGTKPPAETGVQPPKAAAAAPTAAPTTAQPETVIHFAAAGDLVVCDEVVDSGGPGYNYHDVFSDVLPLLADADLTSVNLEGVIAGTPYGSATTSAPADLLTALREAGVDLIQLANSRIICQGVTGMRATVQAVRAAQLEPVGAYATEAEASRARGYTIREVKGVRVAIVAFTKGMDSMALPAGSENCVNLLYSDYATVYQDVDTARITRVLRAVAEEKPDITIALLHWGSEYNDNISDSQARIRELMLSNGVDAIIGTHPHYVQSIDFDAEAGTLVCYSLGDFFGPAARAGTDYSIILNLEITKDNETGVTKVTGYDYTPVYTQAGDTGYRVVRLQPAIDGYELNYIDKVTQDTYTGMCSAKERVEARVVPEEDEE